MSRVLTAAAQTGPQLSNSVGAVDIALTGAVATAVAVAFISRSRRAQAFAFLGLGVVMTVVWLRLGTVDIALAEAALGTGLLSALLVWLATFRPAPASADQRPGAPAWVTALIGLAVGAVTVILVAGVWLRVEQRLPQWDEPLTAQLPGTGVEHGITGVLLAFRAYDTLLESAVLMLAGIIVLALDQGRGVAPVASSSFAVSSTLRWFVRVAGPVLLLFGLWVMFAGSSGPGGAFQSGAVLAGLLILLRMGQVKMRVFDRWAIPFLLVAGIIVFLVLGAVGPFFGQEWFTWGPGWSFAAIVIIEVFLTAGIAVGLYLLFLGLETPVRAAQEVTAR